MSSLQFGLIPCLLPGCVLVVKREEFPLVGAKVHYDLSDVQMLATLTQTYTSNATIDAEIRYVFPLPADASVCSFKAVIDGKRTINGVVKEKAKAKAEYDQAVSQGKTAALLEQDNVEIFQVSLGNIKPKQTIEVHISFVSVISHDGSLDSLRLTFPTVIAPRYGTPPSGMFGSFSLGHSRNALDLSVAVEMTSHIKSITSPSHPIALKLGESTLEPARDFDPRKARVSLSSPELLEKDIVLVLSCQGLDKPRCMVESFSQVEGGQEHTHAYALTLVPRFALPSLPTQEYIFLIDRSGSMGGRKMNAVRSALQIMLVSLPSRGSYFNLFSFGTSHTSLWPHSVAYSADNVKAASAHIDSMTANYGGTEIRAAIEASFAGRAARVDGLTTSTSVFVLTDGQAYDLHGVQSAIQDTVAKSKKEGLLLRVFCMGIGDAVSKAMCDAIARVGHGTAVFVGEDEKPDHKLMGLLRAARGAVIEDISIDWGVDGDTPEIDVQDFEMVSAREGSSELLKDSTPISLFDESSTISSETVDLGPQTIKVKLPPPPRVQQAPLAKSLPPLYPGFRTSLFAIVRCDGRDSVPSKEVRVKGFVLGHPVVLEVPVSQISKPPTEKQVQIKMLHSLAARALIQSLEGKGETSMSEIDKAEVLRLAERYGLASSLTSFVAIDEQGQVMATPQPSENHLDVESEPVSFRRRAQFVPTNSPNLLPSPSGAPLRQSFRASSALPAPAPPPPPRSLFGSMTLFGSAVQKKSTATFGSVASFGSPSGPATTVGSAATFAAPFGSPANSGSATAFGSTANFRSPANSEFAAAFTSPEEGGLLESHSAPSVPMGRQAGLGAFGVTPSIASISSSQMQMASKSSRQPPQPQRAQDLDRQREDLRSAGYTVTASGGGLFAGPSGVLSAQSMSPTIETFARAQSFDGSFASSPGLFQLIVQQPQAPVVPVTLGVIGTLKETVWCTLLCVAYLETQFADEKDIWEILVEKAMQFVEETLSVTWSVDEVTERVRELRQDALKCVSRSQI